MQVKIYKQRGESLYHVVIMSETGRIVHKMFDSMDDMLEYTKRLPIDRIIIDEV